MNNAATISRDDLREWLVGRVAFHLDRPPEKIAPDVELARYGMDSLYAISIISDVEDHLQVELDLSDAAKLGTVDALTDFLLELVDG